MFLKHLLYTEQTKSTSSFYIIIVLVSGIGLEISNFVASRIDYSRCQEIESHLEGP